MPWKRCSDRRAENLERGSVDPVEGVDSVGCAELLVVVRSADLEELAAAAERSVDALEAAVEEGLAVPVEDHLVHYSPGRWGRSDCCLPSFHVTLCSDLLAVERNRI
jgi:hypothetical protein